MVDRSRYQMRKQRMPESMANLEKMVPSTLRGASSAVLTIKEVAEVDSFRGKNPVTGEDEFEPTIVLLFEEIQNRVFWSNVVGTNILLDQYGEDETQWPGKKVPLIVKEGVINPKTKKRSDMLWIASADEWDALFRKAGISK